MDQDVLGGKWQQLQGALRERWGELTDDDLMQIAGKRDRFLGILQERYGYSRQEAERRLNDFLQTYSEKKKALIEQKSWLSRNKGWLVAAALLTSILGIVAYYFRLVKSYDS
ncbi:MAG: CsbD family protein [Ardenticatenaceae bacterium]|nr:CsbD family protein [Ardenticatenaceae bacterium]